MQHQPQRHGDKYRREYAPAAETAGRRNDQRRQFAQREEHIVACAEILPGGQALHFIQPFKQR